MDASLETLLYGMQFRRLLDKELEPLEEQYGLQKIDMLILIFLEHAGEHNTLKDIMQMNMFTRGHLSQSLSHLQKKGYVRMEQDQEDRRCTHNYLTEDSLELVEKLKKIYERIQKIILNGMTQEEQKILMLLVQKVNRNISQEL